MAYINTETNKYPVSKTEILDEFPTTTFPDDPFVPPEKYKAVFPSPVPTYDPITQAVTEGTPTLTNKGHYEQTWAVSDLTAEQSELNRVAAYKASIPSVVSMRQARLALLQAGVLTQVDAAIDAQGDEAAKIEWNYAQEVKRDWPLVLQVTQGLGMTEQQVDDLFKLAVSL